MLKNTEGEALGVITNIQRYTIHDGPGIRTELFFKGCNLRCPWCSNPETVSPARELGVYPKKCIGKQKCGLCAGACPLGEESPLRFDGEGLPLPAGTAAACRDCFRCANECPGEGIKIWGELYTVPELVRLIAQDRSFYQRTGGGVTLNGGEALLQWEFARQLCRACREDGINTCVESALNVPVEHMLAVLEYTDYLICDIKHMDTARHKALTGSGNERILENIKTASEHSAAMVIRTPVVCGYNDEEENIRAAADFIKNELGNRVIQYQLLPYRRMGTEKYETLGAAYPFEDYVPPEPEERGARLAYLAAAAAEYGVNAVVGSEQKWF